ncbi:MAG: ABC transporter permease [Bacteroidetes bacterium]|nr:ABC transporter permease [Bacteroidota bacterium]
MIIALATVAGFQNGIKDKIIGLNGHIVVDDITNVEGSEPTPLVDEHLKLTEKIKSVKGVVSVSACTVRPCIARGETEIDGMVAKGVQTNYDWSFFRQHLVSGKLPDFQTDSNTVLISTLTANRLGLKPGNHLQAIFFKEDSNGNQRARAINPLITGLYSTGLEDYDKLLAITHMSQVRKGLPPGTAFTQWEVRVADFDGAEDVAFQIQSQLPAGLFNVNTARRYNRQIFDWLGILDTNVMIILSLMLIVASITMCTTLLILVTERTQMVGTLKALGSRNGPIRRIFIFQSLFIAITGLLAGNIIAIVFCWGQQHFGWITLPVETYYVNKVLIDLQPWHVPAVDAGTLLLCFLVLFLPALVVGRLNPLKAIRFQ